MIKNIQLKIVLIFFILGMFIIIGLGLFFTNSLEAINTALNTAQITDVIIEEINNIKTVSMISLVLLGVISIIIFAIYNLYFNIDFLNMRLYIDYLDVYRIVDNEDNIQIILIKLSEEEKDNFFNILSRDNYSQILFHSGFLTKSMKFTIVNNRSGKELNLFFQPYYLEIKDGISDKVFEIKNYNVLDKINQIYYNN